MPPRVRYIDGKPYTYDPYLLQWIPYLENKSNTVTGNTYLVRDIQVTPTETTVYRQPTYGSSYGNFTNSSVYNGMSDEEREAMDYTTPLIMSNGVLKKK